MNRKRIKILMLSFSLMLIGFEAYSETPVPKPGQKSNGTSALPPPPGTPIDGGLSILLASGVAYGIYTLKRKK